MFDAETGMAHLYVNGQEAGTAVAATPATVAGAFQIGRARGAAGYRDRWHGEVGDVRTYDRVVVPEEAAELARRIPRQRGHWSLESAPGGLSPEANGGEPLRLAAGTSVDNRPADACDPGADPDCVPVADPLVGSGHLVLDGAGGYAATEGPVVDTGDSFTIGAVVHLAGREPAHPMTVLSQGGQHGDAFKVRYVLSTLTFELVMDHAAARGADETMVGIRALPDGDSGQGYGVAVVHDAASDRITLYPDGRASTAVDFSFVLVQHRWSPDGAQPYGCRLGRVPARFGRRGAGLLRSAERELRQPARVRRGPLPRLLIPAPDVSRPTCVGWDTSGSARPIGGQQPRTSSSE
ncbi:LamG-like jellyroll fold domain-containing protein [Streptomyces sp. ITFR-6]|uniref:LamG-like jellyroll fold domain-containing protein n=1 Tax=Streptomyces sp. ITFR-6 TaxID=3075197 RepID=UPI00288B77A2|nr:LamG-like jellyroll fold domain-containing protein [Streptomyces sp. ITFR-6]WNI30881.1 LamG-like jellyroll fold domain-containing protein [Streptomyces sp. ITFR-6]